MKVFFFALLFVFQVNAQTIHVAVASNAAYAMEQIKKEFEKKYQDVDVKIVLGSSGKLTAQIMHNAPFDLFLSANMVYPQTLHEKKIALHKPSVYAQGSLVLFSKKPRDFSALDKLLLDVDVKKIAMANPKTAPYGKASVEVLHALGLQNNMKHKIVYAQSIAQALAYVLKATDLGFVAKSALRTKVFEEFKQGIHWIEIDPKMYNQIDQGIVLLKNSKDNEAAQLFYDFIFTQRAKEIFAEFGYTIPCAN